MKNIFYLIWVIFFLIKNKGFFEIVMQDDSFNDNYWIYKDNEDNIIKTSFWDIIEDIYVCNK